jgi:hypothetical protein
MSRIWQNFPKKIKNKIQIRKKIPKNSQISLLRKQTKLVLKKKKKLIPSPQQLYQVGPYVTHI